MLLGVLPAVHVLGTSGVLWRRLLAAPASASAREVLVLLPVLGAWLGAAAAAATQALDWVRAWQAWPLPCVLGAGAGVVAGNVLALAVCLVRVALAYVRVPSAPPAPAPTRAQKRAAQRRPRT